MACAYSSSDEFEAAVIRSRVDAGAFGPRRGRRRGHPVVYAVTAAAVVIAIIIAALLML